MNEKLAFILLVCSCLPIFELILLYSFALRAWIKLGHFPIPSMDDPKQLGMDLHYEFIWYSFPFIAYFSIIPFVCILLLIRKISHNKFLMKKCLLLFIVGFLLIWIQIFIDPFKIGYWYLD